MIEPLNNGFDGIVVNKDPCDIIHSPFKPYLNAPSVAMKIRTLPAVMHEPMACVKMNRLVNSGIHQYRYA
jgi:hypothetical protein